MRRFSNIDNLFCLKNELNLSQAYVLEWMINLHTWAEKVFLDGKQFMFASKTKACEDLAILTTKTNTMHKHYKSLEEKGLILVKKVDRKDYIYLTEKCANWNYVDSSKHLEKNPNELGKKSKNNLEKNPTYSIINTNSITNIENDLFGNKPSPTKKTLFKNSLFFEIGIFKEKLKEAAALGIDVEYYHRSISNWNEIKTVKRTANGWIATARTWMEKDKDKGALRMVNDSLSDNTDEEMKAYLNM